MPRWFPFLLPLVASCDDTVFVPPPRAYTPDWDGVTMMIDEKCAVCHAPGAGTQPVLPDALLTDLRDGTGFYVVPGDPSASVLWRVLADELIDGDFAVMPFGRPAMSAEEIAPIKTWIEDGAVVPAETP